MARANKRELVCLKRPYDYVVLTELEQKIVDLLRRDPLIGSDVLAASLSTSRAAINVHLSNLGKKGVILGRGYVLAERPGAVVIGGANIDLKARSSSRMAGRTSNPVHASLAPGGVGRNIAETIGRLGNRVHLISVVGRDPLGENLLEHTMAAGVRVEHIARTDSPTGTYTVVLDVDGELVGAVSDMAAVEELSVEQIQAARSVIASAGILVLDGNVPREVLELALDLSPGVPTVFEPVSVPKAARIKDILDARIYAVTPNRDELAAMTDRDITTRSQVRDAANELHHRGIEVVWVRLGERGSLLSVAGNAVEIAALPTVVQDVTGAGDSMLGAFCHVMLEGGSVQHAARFGHAAAALTIASPHTVRPDLTSRLIEAELNLEELE